MAKQKGSRYYVLFEYDGHDPDYDNLIEKKAGRECSSTGYNFLSGRRDVVFYFYYKYAAKNALKKLKRFKKYKSSVKLVKCEE